MKKSILLIALLFLGCQDQKDIFNKPAMYWYNEMINQIANYNLDKADDMFVSLESEHKKSPLIPTALLILANAYIENEEYLMANFYLDEYLKKYSYSKNADYARYLKIKAKFLSFKQYYRDQKLLDQTIKEANDFILKYPNSKFIYLVTTIQARLYMTKALFDKEIANLYTKLNKPKASKLYNNKAKSSWNNIQEIKNIEVPWYRYIFE